MAERKSYSPGTPSWVDLGTADTQAAARFYGEIFGWVASFDPRPEAGGYGMFSLRDRPPDRPWSATLGGVRQRGRHRCDRGQGR